MSRDVLIGLCPECGFTCLIDPDDGKTVIRCEMCEGTHRYSNMHPEERKLIEYLEGRRDKR